MFNQKTELNQNSNQNSNGNLKRNADSKIGQKTQEGQNFLPPTHPPEVPLWALKSKT